MDRESMVQLFRGIAQSFPHLVMRLELDHPHVDLNLDIACQPGLRFSVNLNLQGDELHLSAGNFWLEWFPCTDEDIARAYVEAVHGLLSGEFRIVEHYRGRRAAKAELQRPSAQREWETIGTWSRPRIPIPWRTSVRVLRNADV